MPFRVPAAALLVLLIFTSRTPTAVPQDQEEQIFVDEIKKDFLEKIKRAETQKDWRSLFTQYQQGLTRYSQKVVPHPAIPGVYTSIGEFLLYRYSKLPKEAYEYYRLEYDSKAKTAFAQAHEENDRRGIERAVEEFFFSSATDENLDGLANAYFEEGRADEAIFYWDRLLRYYPDSEIPRTITAARIAVACEVSANEVALGHLREFLAETKVDGNVRLGGRQVLLSQYVKGIKIVAPAGSSTSKAAKSPAIPDPGGRFRRKIIGVRNDIKRWSYDFTSDKGETSKTDDSSKRVVIRRWRGEEMPVQTNDYPFFAAFAEVRGKDYVLATNGLRLIAVNPTRVRGENTSAGVYWKYPQDGPVKRPPNNSQYQGYYTTTPPWIGCTVSGEYVYATMYSPKRVQDTNPNNMDLFEGPTRIVCIHIPTFQLVWDTDDFLTKAPSQKFDFVERNYTFASPPLVKGDRLYVGISTSPVGEQESRVLCLETKTGRPMWCTFISSVTGGGRNAWWGGSGKYVTYLTLVTEHAGVVYTETNLGVVAALNGVNGSILWLSKYRRALQRANWNYYEPQVIRPANPPLLHKGVLYILPQDANDLVGFDKASGKKVELPTAKCRDKELQWKNVSHLAGIIEDWMVLGGTESYVMRLKDFRAHNLPNTNTSKCGRGLVDPDGTIYMPAHDELNGTLAIYPGVGSWKLLDQPKWKGPNEYGNLLIAGDYLVVMTDRITVYTDVETLNKEFVHRRHQTPANPVALLEHGDIMRENEKLEDAAESYLAFVRAAEGDPKYEARIRAVKMELHRIFMKRGDEAAKKSDAKTALDHYRIARDFAYDAETAADATRKVAASLEALGRWKEAVAAYQELIRAAGDQYYRAPDSEMVDTMWNHARKKIAEILKKEAGAYDEIEKEASAALEKIGKENVEELQRFRRSFPNSRAARDAWKKVLDFFTEKGKWDKVRALLEELKQWTGDDLDFEQSLRVIEILDKIGDLERLPYELKRLAARFGGKTVGSDGDQELVSEYVERRLREFQKRSDLDGAPLRDPLVKVGEMEAYKPSSATHGLGVGYVPLRPLGIEPPDYGRNFELFRRGSTVELWDLDRKQRIWSCSHPGGYMGIVFEEAVGDAAGVKIVEVKKDSPAEKAGLQGNDVLLTINGASATAEALDEALRAAKPGTSLALTYRREKETKSADVELVALPSNMRPAVIGASFTRDYELAICWEDGLASVELKTGRILWTFGSLRERFHVRSFFATDGFVYVFESYRADRPRNPYRLFPQGATPPISASDLHSRLICLNDSSGFVAWIRAYDFDMQTAQNASLQFHAKYLGDSIAIVELSQRQNMIDWSMWVLGTADGQPAKSGTRNLSLSNNLLATAVDLEAGILYYVDGRDQNNRALRSASIDPSKKDFKAIDVALGTKYMDAANFMCTLAASREYVCLLVPPTNPSQAYRIWIFHAKDGREFRSISLPENRTLSQSKPDNLRLDEDGVLYVYNVPKTGGGVGASGRGFVTAYRVGAADVAEILAWDAVAPAMGNTAGYSWAVDAWRGDFVLFYAPKGAAPRESGETAIGAVYSKKDQGYLQILFSDLVAPADAQGVVEPAVIFTRGRLFVSTKQGLQIYGN